jgi:3-dehydroquinate synthase
MGAGKTTAARAAAGVLGADLIDTDEVITAEVGSIAGLFANKGESQFREIEERVVLETLDREGVVVALGGGAVESERIRAALAAHVTVWCQVEEAIAWERASGTDRPLARDRNGFGRRFVARQPLYEDVARAILPSGGGAMGKRVAPWLDALRKRPDVRMAWASSDSADYPALVGHGATEILDPALASLIAQGRLFTVADRAALAAAGSFVPGVAEDDPIELDGGEGAKTLSSAEALLGELARAGIRRDDALIAFGGGVVGDLAGFCAGVYQRGIPVVQVPTTVVAQVDSAYGGKTGVDLPEAKNYVGAFHHPSAVLADPSALESLPKAELIAGFAEVVKTALIAGGSLWEQVRAIEKLEAAVIAPLVFDCARTKIEIVAADEREGGRRAVLNLGHTVGHAVETASGYARYRHGEAVAIGMLAALRLSGADELREEVAELFERTGLPTTLDPAVELDAVIEAIGRDKKQTAEGIGFVLATAPGDVREGQRIDADSLRDSVVELQGQSGR